ncbi:MAG: SNF2-related protein [Actinomycetota bacterium]
MMETGRESSESHGTITLRVSALTCPSGLKHETIYRMSLIDNLKDNTVADALDKILPNCSRMDAMVGYFYFSGFSEVADQLKDKSIRILVGKEIDPRVIDSINTLDRNHLDDYVTPEPITSKTQAKQRFYQQFAKVFNLTDWFDNSREIEAFKLFLSKLRDGSLEIKRTATPQHGKFYLLHFRDESSQGGMIPGVVIEGSSNLTYSGLRGQGEHNRLLTEKHYYESDVKKFEDLWSDSNNVIIANKDNAAEFIQEIRDRIWLYAKPDPYLVYLRMLDEYFSSQEIEGLRSPAEITKGKFSDLLYQKDAIQLGIDRINRFGGVIIADVVGLGKSIIASAMANNLGLKTVVIAPPHLKDQWEDYRFEFDFNAQTYSTGKIEEALERHEGEKNLLIILDEAHKHRNEDTSAYQALHRLCAGNKVVALTATPFNNDPKDIYALIKLFDTPGQSTLRTVENLSTEFRELMSRYKQLRTAIRKTQTDSTDAKTIRKKGEEIASTLRQMIEPIVIRRSRLDLLEIDDYRKDLERQGFSFAKVREPELLEYNLGDLSQKYIATLNRISPPPGTEVTKTFIGARYKPAGYLKNGSKFIAELLEEQEESADELPHSLSTAQTNVAKFMRHLLVRRFESSVYAFQSSLKSMRRSSEEMLDWLERRQEIPIF